MTKNRHHLAVRPVIWTKSFLGSRVGIAAGMRIGFGSRRILLARIDRSLVDLRTADHNLPAHEIGPVQFLGGGLGGIERFHLDEAETLGAVRAAIHRDFHILHRTLLGEEVKQVAFRSFVGEVANVELGRDDLLHHRFSLGPFLAGGTIVALGAVFTGSAFLEIGTRRAAGAEGLGFWLGFLGEESEKLLEKTLLFFRGRTGTAVRVRATFSTVTAAAMIAATASSATPTSTTAAAISASASWAII